MNNWYAINVCQTYPCTPISHCQIGTGNLNNVVTEVRDGLYRFLCQLCDTKFKLVQANTISKQCMHTSLGTDQCYAATGDSLHHC
jgi:hypothetical protein